MKLVISSSFLIAAASSRELQDYTAISGFTPLTDVKDQLHIDLDVTKIMELYEEGTADSIAAAKSIYEEGSYSKSVSSLTIEGGLTVDVPKGTVFKGLSSSGDGSMATARQASTVLVFVYNDALAGDTTLNIHTGGNTTITIDSYTYKPASTYNVYSVQLFTEPSEYSFDGAKYITYYGSDTFNDDIIQAVFAGSSTSFATGKDFDFSGMSTEEHAEILETALGYLAVRNYVFRELEHAIYLCATEDGCTENSCFNKPAVHEVDEAVALYVGSLEGADGSGEGVLTYDVANNRGEEFGVASNGFTNGNSKIFDAFDDASAAIVANDCDGGRTATATIAQLNPTP